MYWEWLYDLASDMHYKVGEKRCVGCIQGAEGYQGGVTALHSMID